MEYEIVKLHEKKVVGLQARTNNSSPDMAKVIGGLWQRFFGEGIYSAIENKKDGKALGIYTDYEGNETCDYTILVACEGEKPKKEIEGTVYRTIPAGTYARFVVKGDLHQAVAAFWAELWNMDLPRSFGTDFEEYQNSDEKNAEIHMYIGLKEEE